MNPAYRLAKVHLGLLLLSVPLAILFYVDAPSSDPSTTDDKWAYIAVGIVYMVIAVTGKPVVLFEGLRRLGVIKRVVRLLVITVALFAASVAVSDLDRVGTALGVLATVSALGLFLRAIAIALFREKLYDEE